jgi:hypothetical protein
MGGYPGRRRGAAPGVRVGSPGRAAQVPRAAPAAAAARAALVQLGEPMPDHCDRCGANGAPLLAAPLAHPRGFWLCGRCRPVLSRDEIACRVARGQWPAPYAPVDPPWFDTGAWIAPPPPPPLPPLPSWYEPVWTPRAPISPPPPPQRRAERESEARVEPAGSSTNASSNGSSIAVKDREEESLPRFARGAEWWYRDGPISLPVIEVNRGPATLPRWVRAALALAPDPEDELTGWIDAHSPAWLLAVRPPWPWKIRASGS